MLTGPPSHRSLRDKRSFAPGALLPGIRDLRRYERTWLAPDVLAGITVAAYLIPQVMAYAQIARLPAAVGLFGAIAPAIAYAIFGTSRHLSIGPESTTALLTGTAVLALAGGGDRSAALAAALAIVVGILCVIGWFGGLGWLGDLLSRPVLVGYLSGVAVLMIVSQIQALTGITTAGESIPQQIYEAIENSRTLHWPTASLAAGLLVYLFVGSKLLPRWPHPLIAVLIGAAIVWCFELRLHGVRTVGEIPTGLPLPQWPSLSWQAVAQMLVPALGIAIVGFSESVIGARAFAQKGEPPTDANQEFLALGAANLAAGVTGGLPVSASASRAAIGASMRSRTQLTMLVAAGVVLLAINTVGPVLSAFPKPALGALVAYAGIRLIAWGEIRRIARFRRSEFILLLATVVGVLVLGVLWGIVAAIALSLGDLLRRVARGHDGILGYVPGLDGMHDVADYPDARQVPGLVIYRYDSPLFFANAEDFAERARAAVVAADPPARWLLLNAEANDEVDLTSLDALEHLRSDLEADGVVLALARVKQELLVDLRACGLAERIGEERIFPTLPRAVRAYLKAYRDEHGTLPAGVDKLPKPSRPARLEESGD